MIKDLLETLRSSLGALENFKIVNKFILFINSGGFLLSLSMQMILSLVIVTIGLLCITLFVKPEDRAYKSVLIANKILNVYHYIYRFIRNIFIFFLIISSIVFSLSSASFVMMICMMHLLVFFIFLLLSRFMSFFLNAVLDLYVLVYSEPESIPKTSKKNMKK